MEHGFANLSHEALAIISAAEKEIIKAQGHGEKVALVAYKAEH